MESVVTAIMRAFTHYNVCNIEPKTGQGSRLGTVLSCGVYSTQVTNLFCYAALVALLTLVRGDIGVAQQMQDTQSPLSNETTSAQVWRSQRLCGVNCLYAFLRWHGVKACYEDLEGDLLSEEGTNMSALQNAALRYGIEATVAKASPGDLRRLGMPVIIHLEELRPNGHSAAHFVLVTKCNDKSVTCMDGTSAVLANIPWPKLEAQWTGYILFRMPSEGKSTMAFAFGGVLCGVCIAVATRWLRAAVQWVRRAYA